MHVNIHVMKAPISNIALRVKNEHEYICNTLESRKGTLKLHKDNRERCFYFESHARWARTAAESFTRQKLRSAGGGADSVEETSTCTGDFTYTFIFSNSDRK